MTPVETMAVLDAAAWRMEREQRMQGWLAWHVAALSRAKRLPPLRRLLRVSDGKSLDGEDLEERRSEFKELRERMLGNMDVLKR